MFTRHSLSPTNKLDCPHAMGTNAFSPQRAESFRHFLLLPSPHSTPSLRSVPQGRLHSTPSLRLVPQGRLHSTPSLHSVAQGRLRFAYYGRQPTNLRVSLGARA